MSRASAGSTYALTRVAGVRAGTTDLEIQLEPGVVIRGRVVDADGAASP